MNKWMYTGINTCYDKNSSWPWFPVYYESLSLVMVSGEPWMESTGSNASLMIELPKGNEPLGVKRRVKIRTGNQQGYFQAYMSSTDLEVHMDVEVLYGNGVFEITYDVGDYPYDEYYLVIEGLGASYKYLQIKELCFTEDNLALTPVLVDVCNDVGDQYPFGFNGEGA